MYAQTAGGDDQRLEALAHEMNQGAESAARDAFRSVFERLKSQWAMYPSGSSPAAIFESAAHTAGRLAAVSLPLSLAVSMHLYPLCALQCVPIPLLSAARFQRAMLLRTITDRSLILANAGSERARGLDEPVLATLRQDGVMLNGTFEYMSLASVADIVFLKARCADGDASILCAADLRADTVKIGSWKFSGSMRLSDTCSVTFRNHWVPRRRSLYVPNNEGLQCISDYQRCWFHLLLGELYLARVEHLHSKWSLTRSTDHMVSLNELSRVREYSLRLLDELDSLSKIEPLVRTTTAMKLRVSLMAQSTIEKLHELADSSAVRSQAIRADASELSYIRWQPTADEKILASLGCGGRCAVMKVKSEAASSPHHLASTR